VRKSHEYRKKENKRKNPIKKWPAEHSASHKEKGEEG